MSSHAFGVLSTRGVGTDKSNETTLKGSPTHTHPFTMPHWETPSGSGRLASINSMGYKHADGVSIQSKPFQGKYLEQALYLSMLRELSCVGFYRFAFIEVR